MLFLMTNVKSWKYSTRLEQGALSSEVSKSPIFIVGMVSQLYQLYNQSFFLKILTLPWRFSFLLWSSLLSFSASTSDTKRSKKNSKLSLLRIDTYILLNNRRWDWIQNEISGLKLNYHHSIWIMKLNFQRSKLEGWSIWSERARQLVSKALEVIATGEVYHEPPMDATNERQPMVFFWNIS